MKRIYSLLISIVLCAVIFCQAGLCFTLSADEVNTVDDSGNISLAQLVRLKKILAGIPVPYSVKDDFNYDLNNDGEIDATDITILRQLILGIYINTDTDTDVKDNTIDKDGFYNQVIKP